MPNPADRLLSILLKGKEHKNEESCREVWRVILEVPENKDAIIVARLGKVMELPLEIVKQIDTRFSDESDTYKYWVSQVSTAFKIQNLNGKWETFNSNIDGHTISYLRLSSKLLSVMSGCFDLSADKLTEIRTIINELLSSIRQSDLDENAKAYLIRSLHRILLAIDEHVITGAFPIIDAIEASYGHAVADPIFRESVNNSSIGKRLWDGLSTVATIVTIATGLPQLASDITSYIDALPKP